MRPIPAVAPAATAVSSKPVPATKNLSKKERQALRQKELDELDAVLSEFKVDLGTAPAVAPVGPTPGEAEMSQKEDSSSSKKKKSKKKKSPGAAVVEEEASPAVVDIAAVLRAKAAKAGAKKPALTEAERIAAAEAKAQNEKKKKKSDKSKFNEMPDFN